MPLATMPSVDKIDPRDYRGLVRVTTSSGSQYLIACGAKKLAHVTNANHGLCWKPLTFNFTVRKHHPMVMHCPEGGHFGPTSDVKSIDIVGIGEIEPQGPEVIYHVSTTAGMFELMVTGDPQDVAIIEALDPLAMETLQRCGLPTEYSFNCNFGVGDGTSSCNGDLKVGEEAAFGLHKTGGKYFTAFVTGIEPQE